MKEHSGQYNTRSSVKNKISNNPDRLFISVITPAYNESQNLGEFYRQLDETSKFNDFDWEWIIIDDHSADQTFNEAQRLNVQDDRVKGVRLSRNFGSHTAISCGIELASGECAVVMAADLQDPPSAIPLVLEKWREGFQIVWAARGKREGTSKTTRLLSRLFFFIMRRIVGIKEMPASGADFFLLDKKVCTALNLFSERNLSIAALITWMGFEQTIVFYKKKERLHGKSGWTIKKKINIFIDSITSFSFFPIRFMSLLGVIVSLLGFLYAMFVFFNALTGTPPSGWASLMVVVLILGGFQMLMLGVLGEYLWRALDEARNRPRYLVERIIGLLKDE